MSGLVDQEAMGQRERGKARRRDSIIQAARELIRETGETGLSMRALALRAKVGITTPYNLFGSKGAILSALVNEDFRHLAEELRAMESRHDLSRIVDFVRIICKQFRQDPHYYRAIMSETFSSEFNPGDLLGRDEFNIWRNLVLNAWNAGYVQKDIDPSNLASALISQFISIMYVWIRGTIGLQEMESRISFGIALLMLGVSSEDGREYLSGEVRSAQAEMHKFRREKRLHKR